jgi:hypothetical protein
MIRENICKVSEKLNKLKNFLLEDEEDGYENFHNRLNFYFSTIITELKLKFYEGIKVYENIENQLNCRITVNNV